MDFLIKALFILLLSVNVFMQMLVIALLSVRIQKEVGEDRNLTKK